MGIESPGDIDRASIEEHTQRTVEQTALRKVRKTLDDIEATQATERRTLRKILLVCAILVAVGVWFFWWLAFSGRNMPKQPPMQVPGKLEQKQ